jgi:hypothetical protein
MWLVASEHLAHRAADFAQRAAIAERLADRYEQINSAWTVIACLAHNLQRWTAQLGLTDRTPRATHKRRMLAEVRVLCTEDELALDTERVALQALFDALHQFRVGYDAQLHKRTLALGLLSLIGPGCDAALAASVFTRLLWS